MWQKERDLLLAQTMAFVQSVTGKPMDAEGLFETRLQSTSPDQPTTVGRPVEVLPIDRLSPAAQNGMRDDILRRVAAFRARQQVFARDRNEYCDAMMARARATTEQADKARDNPPLKR
jgi:hypothetical protein